MINTSNTISDFVKPEFEIYGRFLILTLPQIINREIILNAQENLVHHLYTNKKTNAVVFGFSKLIHADQDDLEILAQAVREIRLMGAEVGIFGVNPGIAALIVQSNIDLNTQASGIDLEDIIHRLTR